MDTIAMWVGYIVMAVSTGIFVIGGTLMIADHFARRVWQKLNAAHDLKELSALSKRIIAARDGSGPVIPQPQSERRR